MKNNLSLILAAVCLVGAQHCAAEDIKSLKAQFEKLTKSVLFGTKNVLLNKPDDASIKKLNDFLGSKFLNFIGSDDKKRQVYAKDVVADFKRLLQGIVVVFGKLAIAADRPEEYGKELSTASDAEVQARKNAILAKRNTMKVIDPEKIPWGTKGQGGARPVSVNQVVGSPFEKLNEIEQRINDIKSFASTGRSSCRLQPCRDRFDLLIEANEWLETLVQRIKGGIEDLHSYE